VAYKGEEGGREREGVFFKKKQRRRLNRGGKKKKNWGVKGGKTQ
jgi:hypothetical protein